MCGIALYSVVLASPQQLEQIRGDALATLTYSANWHEIFGHYNYFALFTAPSPLNHTWSLAIEEQFYLIWPLVFVGLLAWWKRSAPQAVLVTSLVLAGVSTALMFALYAPDVSRDYYGTDTRATAILLGAALGGMARDPRPRGTRSRSHRARSRRAARRGRPCDRVDAPQRRFSDALPRRILGLRSRRDGLDRRRGASEARSGRVGAVVATAVRARSHQLRRVPLPLADRRRVRFAGDALRRLAAVRVPDRARPRRGVPVLPFHRNAGTSRRGRPACSGASSLPRSPSPWS